MRSFTQVAVEDRRTNHCTRGESDVVDWYHLGSAEFSQRHVEVFDLKHESKSEDWKGCKWDESEELVVAL